jgi:8-oxo-dGTP diphosphatase
MEAPRVGVGVFVLRERRVLLGLRRGAHGQGSWALPGGHLEYAESVEACARREVAEETGIELGRLRAGPYSSDLFEAERKHYVTLFVLADWLRGEAELREPAKCSAWGWFEWESLPQPLFAPLMSLKQQGYEPQEVR